MIGVFDNVCFYIIPATGRRLKENKDKMISILRTGAASYKSVVDDDITHIICNSSDFAVAKKSVSDSAFCCFVTPKWVFISQLLHYSLPVRNYSADPYHIFSGLVFYFHNCSISLNQVYLPLCIHYGSQVLTSIMSQCSHVIVFNSTECKDLPPEISSYPQISVVSESWIGECIKTRTLVDEIPYLLQQPSQQNDQITYQIPNTNFIYEWESDIRASVDHLFEGSPVDYSSIFKNLTFLFLPSIDHQEIFFLSCSVEKMGGKVLTPLSTFEETITSSIPPNTQDPVTHIICPYLKSGQKSRLTRLLHGYSVPILSTNWLYSCVDQYSYLDPNTPDKWNSILFFPSLEMYIPRLRDCVISVTGFTSETTPTREQVKSAIDVVGACYMGPLCKDYTTHLICYDETSAKYKAVKTWGVKIHVVKSDWLFECMKRWDRVDEEEYAFGEEEEKEEEERKEKVDEDGISTGDEEEEEKQKEEVNEDSISTGDEDEEEEKMEEENSKVEEEEEKIKVEEEKMEEEKDSNISLNLQNNPIYTDSGFISSSKRNSPPSQSPSPKRPAITDKYFLLSSDVSAEVLSLSINHLHGHCIQTHDTFDSSATHFIIANPKRTEKFLGAVAKGMWILKPEYVIDSEKAGKWLDEEEYEWKETDAKSRINGKSIQRWRENQGNAFSNKRIVLVGELMPSSEKWSRIIEAGGGACVTTKASVTNSVKGFVKDSQGYECFAVIPDSMKKNKLIQFLVDNQFVCIPSSYLLDYLSKDPLPSIQNYIIYS